MYITEDGDESSSKRKLIKKDRDFLLENFEPMTVCDTVMTSMFDENDMMIMRNIKGRRKRAESFLEMCDKLPKEKFEMIFSSYFLRQKMCQTMKKWVSFFTNQVLILNPF